MFGRKARYIEALENQNDQLAEEAERMRTIYSNAEPFIPFAEALRERVEQRTEQVDVEDMDAAFDRAMEDVEEDMVQQHIETKLSELPPDQLMNMYAARFDDETVLEALQNAAKKVQRETQKNERKDIIRQQAKEGHYFDLGHVLEDEIVHIRLNSRSEGPHGSSYHARVVRLRKYSEEDNLFVVLYDGPEHARETWRHLDSSRLPINSTVQVGASIVKPDGRTELDNRISFFAPLSIRTSDSILPESTGYLVTRLALGSPNNIVLNSTKCRIA